MGGKYNMTKKVICSKINQEVFLTFDTIKASTFDNPNQYIIGLFSNCSACENICKDCSVIETLQGKSISL